MTAFWIIFTGIHSAFFAYMLSQHFHQRSESKLYAQHRKQLDELRSQYRGEYENRASLTAVSSSLSPRYEDTFEQARLRGKVKGMSAVLDDLRRRVANLEAVAKDDQRGAA